MKMFVVGSGRCGSTLLTTMLAKHPDILLISEFFAALDRSECFSTEIISGKQFAKFLDRSSIAGEICIRRGNIPKEILSNKSDTHRDPPLMISTLPMLSNEPEKLYEEVLEAVNAFPAQGYLQHYNDLFSWLMTKMGKQYWVERSGASIEYLPDLVKLYPEAKYVYLHRDGPESCLSMMRHQYFQLIVSFFYDPPTYENLKSTEYGGNPVRENDTFSKRLSPGYLKPEKYAEYWSYQQALGFKGLAELDREQYIFVRFEDLATDPVSVLQSIAAFFELPHQEGWVEKAAKYVKGVPPSRFEEFSQDVQESIRSGCEIGQLMLGRITSPWVKPTLETIKELRAKQFAE